MELGADHLLEAPASQAVLEAVLAELAGAPGEVEGGADEGPRPRLEIPEDLGKYADPPEEDVTIADATLLDAAFEEDRARKDAGPDLDGQPDPEEFRLEPELETPSTARAGRASEDEPTSPAWRTRSSPKPKPNPRPRPIPKRKPRPRSSPPRGKPRGTSRTGPGLRRSGGRGRGASRGGDSWGDGGGGWE